MPRGILRDLTFSRLVSAVWPAWEAGATGWTLPDVTVLSFSSPLLRAVLRLERGCFLSGLPSTGTALRGFTGWGLQRQIGGALRGWGWAAQGKGGAAGLLGRYPPTWRWLPLHSQGLGTAVPSIPQPPAHLIPSDDLPVHGDSRGLLHTSLHLYPVFARAALLHPSSLPPPYCDLSLVVVVG